MKVLKIIWKVLKTIAKIASFIVSNQSLKDLCSDLKNTWKE